MYDSIDIVVTILNALHVFIMTLGPTTFLIVSTFEPRRLQKTISLPSCTIIIPCYLPNEKDIILDTIRHCLQQHHAQKVVLVYNTPEPIIELENTLMNLSQEHCNFICLHASDSTSRGENLRFALKHDEVTDSETILLLDADHRCEENSIYNALCEFLQKSTTVKCIQGSIVVRGDTKFAHALDALGLLSGILLQCTFQSIAGSALYIGAGALWETETLKRYSFNKLKFNSEDMDLSFRLLSNKWKIQPSVSVRISELAPSSYYEFYRQRLRWVSGFEECRYIHFCNMLRRNPRSCLIFYYTYLTYIMFFANIANGIINLSLLRTPSQWVLIPGLFAVLCMFLLYIVVVIVAHRESIKDRLKWITIGILLTPLLAVFQTLLFVMVYLRKPCPIKNHVTQRVRSTPVNSLQ